MFIVKSHGGFCCGITHIYGFGGLPTGIMPERVAQTAEEYAEYIRHYPQYYGQHNLTYPQQTQAERLKAVIEDITKGRTPDYYKDRIPKGKDWSDLTMAEREQMPLHSGRQRGVIEVVLVNSYYTKQVDNWESTLLKLGFKEVNSSVNSNSSNTIRIYHLNTGE